MKPPYLSFAWRRVYTWIVSLEAILQLRVSEPVARPYVIGQGCLTWKRLLVILSVKFLIFENKEFRWRNDQPGVEFACYTFIIIHGITETEFHLSFQTNQKWSLLWSSSAVIIIRGKLSAGCIPTYRLSCAPGSVTVMIRANVYLPLLGLRPLIRARSLTIYISSKMVWYDMHRRFGPWVKKHLATILEFALLFSRTALILPW